MAYISKRGEKWQYVVRYKDSDGNYQRKSKSGFAKKKDAQEAAIELERQITEGGVIDDDPTFVDYYFHWIETYKLGKHSRVTESRYKTIGKQLRGYFGVTRKLKDIKRSDWQNFINFFGENHARDTT